VFLPPSYLPPFNGCFPGNTGLPVTPFVLFRHLFQERIFEIAGTGYQGPDILPVTIHQRQDTKGTQCTDPNWWPDLVPRWPPDSWRKERCWLYTVPVAVVKHADIPLVLLRFQNVSRRSVSVGFAEKTSVFSSV